VELKRPFDTPRKKFIIELSHEIVDRIFTLHADQVPQVATIMDAAVGRGDLQVWFADGARQSLLDGTMIAGELPKAPKGDFLSVVEFNATASKANAQLERTITYSVTKGGFDGRLVGHVTIHYVNHGTKTEINPYYAGDVRIYVPQGTDLVPYDEPVLDTDTEEQRPPGEIDTIDVHAAEIEPATDGPYDVFGASVVVSPDGGQATVRVSYELPKTVTADGHYSLTWYRQAGTSADKLSGTVLGQPFTTNAAQRYFSISRSL